ncbi:hypothetical protein FRB99_004450 [Tulasnella sp. 403]|nr:hypothetical protein FRB99_004450 [Tulasnella sp. 403]
MHTEISEQLSPFTRTDLFNKGLEIQQNLLASYEPNSQISAIEDLISQQAPLQLVLRLLCIASLTSGGIKAKSLENIKREILQTYGYELLPLLLSLNSLSLLLPNPLPKPAPTPTPSNQTGSTSLKPPPIPPVFTSVRKSFRLLSDTPEATPTDVSYVYSGHAPLSVRLVQAVAMKGVVLTNLPLVGGASSNAPESSAQTNLPAGQREPRVEKVASHPITGWKGFEDTLRLLPGALVDEIQKGDGDSKSSTCESPRAVSSGYMLKRHLCQQRH